MSTAPFNASDLLPLPPFQSESPTAKQLLTRLWFNANNIAGSLNYHASCLRGHGGNANLTEAQLRGFMVYIAENLERLAKEQGGWQRTD